MSKKLEIAIEAAKVGAKLALPQYKKNIKVTRKYDDTVVTKLDTDVEKAIKNYILSQDPAAVFVAEESGGDKNAESFWIIDPIDGTRPFTRGIPTWCVLIAYFEKGKITIGVCYFPILNEMLWAEKGKGAFLNGKRTTVSNISQAKDALVGFGSLRFFKYTQPILDLTQHFGSTRSFDPTYAHFLVASGSMEAMVDAYAQVWDAAPFKVIVEEAGGKITAQDGSPWTIHTRGFVATNGLLHDNVITILNKKK